MEMLNGLPWALATVFGALVLLAAIGYGIWVNRKRSAADRRFTEAATRREYAAEDKDRPHTHLPT